MTELHDPPNEKPYNILWAILSYDENGNEGIVGVDIGILNPIPAVTGDPSMLTWYISAWKRGPFGSKKFRIAKFLRDSSRDVEMDIPK